MPLIHHLHGDLGAVEGGLGALQLPGVREHAGAVTAQAALRITGIQREVVGPAAIAAGALDGSLTKQRVMC